MKTKRAQQPPAGRTFNDNAAVNTLRNFPDRRNGISLALEDLTDAEWGLELPEGTDRRRYVPVSPEVWHPIELEPVQIEIANTDPEMFIGILKALLQGWWPTEAEHEVIRRAHAALKVRTLAEWTHNYVQAPQAGVVFAAPADDGRVLFLSRTQINDGADDTQYLVALIEEKLQGEHPTVWDRDLIPEPPVALAENGSTALVDILKADTLFTKDEGKALTDNPGARMERNGLVLTAVNEHGRTATEQELSEWRAAGLVVDDENGLLNWEGVNYVKQELLQEYQVAARTVGEEKDAEIARLKKAYADLLQARETIDPTAEFTYERDRAEAVELVEAMLAGAGFEMLRDGADGSGAMFLQRLESRTGVQVFLTVPEGILAAGPANVFAYVKANVGVAL